MAPFQIGSGGKMTQPSHPYFGSPLNHPDQRSLGTWNGDANQQSEDFVQGVAMLKMGFIPSKTTLPDFIELCLEGGLVARGTIIPDSIARVNSETIRLILAQWEDLTLRIAIVEIDRDNKMKVEIRENPPDPTRAMNTHAPTPSSPSV